MAVTAWILIPESESSAQTIRGRLLEQSTRRPITAALIVLVDSTDQEIHGVLSNEEGRFSFRALNQGKYRLRAEHIGYRTTVSAPLELGPGEIRAYEMLVPVEPVELETLAVETEPECVVRPEEGVKTAYLWEEARKALNAVRWSEREQLFMYEVVHQRRQRDPRTLVVLKEETDTTWRLAIRPFVAADAASLVERGFIQESRTDTFYYAPDAELLLSDAFLDTHCFRVRRADEPGLVGLGFEPVPGRAVPDIQGVLWLDEATAAPQFLEYRYTGLDIGVPSKRFGGRVEFTRLPTGTWIMGGWLIRGPIIGLSRIPGQIAKRRAKLVAVKEEGGRVLRILPRENPVTDMPDRRAVLEGTVFDSVRMNPLIEAKVYLSGTKYVTTTDRHGRYRLASLPPGAYSLTFDHPRLDTLRYYPVPTELSLPAGGKLTSDLAVPSLVRVRSERLIRFWANVSRVDSPDSLVNASITEAAAVPGREATEGSKAERLIQQALLNLRRFEITRQRDSYHRSVAALKLAVKESPKFAWSQYALGMALARGPQVTLEGAIGYRQRAVQNLSLAEKDARRTLLMAVELDPLLNEAALELAFLGLASRNGTTLRLAKDALQRAIDGSGTQQPEVWVALADIEAALGDPVAAMRAAQEALQIDPGHPSASHALADALFLQPGREGAGADAYFEGLLRLDEDAAMRYWEDLLPVVTEKEKHQWSNLGLAERSDWLDRYWEMKAAVAGVTVPELLAEHYRRLAAANANYRRIGFRGAPPPEALLSDREYWPLPFDDRGLILIRHGEPDEVIRTHRPKIPSNETWVYRRADTPLWLFHFFKLKGRPDFVLSGQLPKCDPFYYKYGDSGADVEQQAMTQPQPFTIWELDPLIDYYEDRASFDHRYQGFISRCLAAVDEINRIIADSGRVTDFALRAPLWQTDLAWNELGARTRQISRLALKRETYSPKFEEDLHFLQQIYSFRDLHGRTELTAALLVPVEHLQPDISQGPVVYSLAASFIVADTIVERAQRRDTVFHYRSNRLLEKGKYLRTHLVLRSDPQTAAIFRISVKDAMTAEHGRVVGGPLNIPDYSRQRLGLSDLVLAESEDGPWQRGETRLALRPGHTFGVGEPFKLFYEIYHLPRGAPYRTEIVVEPKGEGGAWSQLKRLLGIHLPARLSLEFEGLAGESSIFGLQELRQVTGSLLPGEYTLRVTVTNLEWLESATGETYLTVVR